MNILQAKKKKEKQLLDLYLPKEVDLAINLIHTFINNIGKNKTNTLGLKLGIILSGARSQIEYDKDNRVKFEVDELCEICKINRRQLSSQIKKVISTNYHFIDINGDIVGTTPIHTYRYTRDNKYIYISVSAEAKKLFGELGKGGYRFTQALTENLFDLKHKHSLRMQLFLEMINNYNKNSSKKIEMTLEEINGYFSTNYKRFVDIERKILKPVQDEITHSNSLTFKYDFKDTKSGGRPKIDKVIIDVIDNSQNLFALDSVELKKTVPIEQQIRNEIDVDMFPSDKRDFYVERLLEFIDYCVENNKQYKNWSTSFSRHVSGYIKNLNKNDVRV